MYKLIKNSFNNEITTIQRLSDLAFIPLDPANRDYQEYLQWVALGNEPLPVEEPTT
jgi:hypothetical protein